jgi:hypothetical protein
MPFNALAKLRDDKAIPDGRDLDQHIGRRAAPVKAAPAKTAFLQETISVILRLSAI